MHGKSHGHSYATSTCRRSGRSWASATSLPRRIDTCQRSKACCAKPGAWESIQEEELEKVTDVRSAPGSVIPAGRSLSKGEPKSLMAGCVDGTPVGIRDAAVIALAYGSGFRSTEISGLSLEDIRTEGVGMVVRVVGKGAKERLVYLDNGAMGAIADYIEARAVAKSYARHRLPPIN